MHVVAIIVAIVVLVTPLALLILTWVLAVCRRDEPNDRVIGQSDRSVPSFRDWG